MEYPQFVTIRLAAWFRFLYDRPSYREGRRLFNGVYLDLVRNTWC